MKKNLISSESWIVGLTGLILTCSLINLYFQNHYSTLLTTLIILITAIFKQRNKHQNKKLILLFMFFSICTTIISLDINSFTNPRISLEQINKKEYQFRIINVKEKKSRLLIILREILLTQNLN